jgi:CRP-like cAMP-binding protein
MKDLYKRLRKLVGDRRFEERREFLRSLSLCKGLKERELGYLLQSFHSRIYNEGEVLFLEGDIGRALFVIESGRVELSKVGPDNKPKRIAELHAGGFFGEMALLEHMPRSASATALEKSRILLLYRSKLDEILYHHPKVGVSIMAHLAKLLSARLRKTSEQLASLDTASLGV